MKSNFSEIRVALVGSQGFIGRNLNSYFESRGFEMILFNRTNSIMNGLDKFGNLKNIKADFLIWAASSVNPQTAQNNRSATTKEVGEWKDFLGAWKRSGNASTPIIFLSSGGCVYDGDEEIFRESQSSLGANEYGRMKAAQEMSLRSSGLDYAIARISNAYGNGQLPGKGQGVIAEWLHGIGAQKPLVVYGSLLSFRDYIHVSDVCFAIESIMANFQDSDVYNVGSGVKTTLSELVQTFTCLFESRITFEYKLARSTDRLGFVLDVNKIEKITGWKTKTTLDLGIRESLLIKDNEN